MTPNILRGLMGILGCSLGMSLMIPPLAQAQSVEQFYKGRSITILVGNSPGGINDISARLMARHIGRFIPGNPGAVVRHIITRLENPQPRTRKRRSTWRRSPISLTPSETSQGPPSPATLAARSAERTQRD